MDQDRSVKVPGAPLKTFLFKICALGVLVQLVIGSYIALFPLWFFDVEYPMYRNQYRVSRGEGPSARILIFGDSRTQAGVDPRLIADDALSLCLSGAGPIENYYLLKAYLENHPPPKLIFMAVDPVNLQEAMVFWGRTMKFKILSVGQAWEVFRLSMRMGHFPTERPQDPFKPALFLGRLAAYSINFFPSYLNNLEAGRWAGMREKNRLKALEIKRRRGSMRFGLAEHADALDTVATREGVVFKASPVLDFYLRKTLDLIRDKGIEFHYRTLPFNAPSFDVIGKKYRDDHGAYLESVFKDYPGFKLDTTIERWPSELYGDPSHMNTRGASRYSKLLRQALGEG